MSKHKEKKGKEYKEDKNNQDSENFSHKKITKPLTFVIPKTFEERTKGFDFSDRIDTETIIFHMRQLLNIAKALSSSLELNDVLDRIIYSCFGQFQVEKAAIFLAKDIDDPNFTLTQLRGYDTDYIIELPYNSKILEFFRTHLYCIRHKELMEQDMDGLKAELDKLSMLEPVVYVPFRDKNEINGLLILNNKLTGEQYVNDELEFLTTLAGFAGLAVANAKFYGLAILDRMTKLHHHHHFKDVLKDEIEKAKKNNTPLSLIMLDIDHFKHYNDTFGHQQGDIVLIEIAKILKNECKNKLIPARYGGEEFTIIMPNTPEYEAINFAELLRVKIEKHVIPSLHQHIRVTASFGVSQCNYSDHSEIIIKKVDTALYKSKHDGRNRVTVYTTDLLNYMENNNKTE